MFNSTILDVVAGLLFAFLTVSLDLMIAGPEGGPSSDMQRYDG